MDKIPPCSPEIGRWLLGENGTWVSKGDGALEVWPEATGELFADHAGDGALEEMRSDAAEAGKKAVGEALREAKQEGALEGAAVDGSETIPRGLSILSMVLCTNMAFLRKFSVHSSYCIVSKNPRALGSPAR